jgi:hypothetical protein
MGPLSGAPRPRSGRETAFDCRFDFAQRPLGPRPEPAEGVRGA